MNEPQKETAVATRSNNPLDPFRIALTNAKKHFEQALPTTVAKYLTPDRVAKVTLAAISRTPALLQCTPDSVLRAVMQAVELGLEPTGGALGHAYLVPFKNSATLIVGYRGYIDLARRSGQIQSVEAHVVYEHDDFLVEYGIEPRLVHKPKLSGERGDIIAAYCIANFVGGGRHCEVMTRADIDAVRARSRSGDHGPWKTDFAEMARKTAVRRAAKYWPLSPELVKAMDLEDRVEYDDPITAETPEENLTKGVVALKSKVMKKIEAKKEEEPPHNEITGEISDAEKWANVGPPPYDDREPGSEG